VTAQPGETEDLHAPLEAPLDVDAEAETGVHWAPPVDAMAVVTEFLAALASLDVEGAMRLLEPDATYHETTGPSGGIAREARDYLGWVGVTASAFRSEVHTQFAFEGVVVNERTDHWIIGGSELHVPVVGVFEIERGKIVSWSDTTSHDLDEMPNAETPVPNGSDSESPIELDDHLDGAPVPEDAATARPSAVEPTPPPEPAPPVEPTPLGEPAPVIAVPTDANTDADRIAALEGQLHDWRRRAVIWRERSIQAQTLAETQRANVDDLRANVDDLRANVDDLRRLVRALEAKQSTESPQEQIDPPVRTAAVVPVARATRPAPNWKRLLSKDFWKELS
jgi:limonene-1,2-epoxide hydrolase